jgi:endonuclease YncB( thermonuclease family)
VLKNVGFTRLLRYAAMNRTLGILLAAAVALALPAIADARRGPCVAGTKAPRCTFTPARVTFVADGDTIRADIARDGTRRPKTIRITGINAMELHRYSSNPRKRRGECHAVEATALVDRYIRGSRRRILVAAQRPGSRSNKRLRRSVWVKVGGRWRDLARLEMEAGLALWLPNGREFAHNEEYHVLAEQAAAAKRGIHDPDACGAGPDQDLPVTLTVNWDADGNDRRNLNGEWADIHNAGARPLSLRGWWFRDSWLTYDRRLPGYAFPRDASIPAGGTVRVHMGCGRNTATDLHWCQKRDVFENVTTDRRRMGDGGYLFDPQGDLRATMTYPCVFACVDALRGKVDLTAHPRSPESIAITNVSGAPVDLHGHVVKLHLIGARDAFVFGYPFGRGSVVNPGETMTVVPAGSPSQSSRLVRYLGRGRHVLTDGGNVVSLRTMTDLVTDCYGWGDRRC